MESHEKKWYVLHTYSGYENKVKANLESRAQTMGMEKHIFRVAVPEEKSYDQEDSGKVEMEKTFPGYVLVEMVMSDQSWFVVRNTPGVTGFVGSHGAGSKPAPLLDEEIEHILKHMGATTRYSEEDFEIGETVSIKEGAFEGMAGKIVEVDREKFKLHVEVEMFGRETDTELDFNQVEKF
ncbi:transcription termination/antitermination protein NusG [Holzapfeliella floricola]|uniref:Transcription termination/antitermination protein NusG n=1 Tax=Holzapfeliella floricola DSM 23037 = JCM 16512 TaxID=1423744 RepID=A0A0R2DM23_9LACO|nr:transcription termination/antitermination protein NusG [Holzapfeliella floricola]KRN04235.1 transcription antitermination protein NusG [Holzapfeliella floricola DSM 23037 = JCM 16512]